MVFNQFSLLTAGGWVVALLLLVFCLFGKKSYDNKVSNLQAEKNNLQVEIQIQKLANENNERIIEDLRKVNKQSNDLLAEMEEELYFLKTKSSQMQNQIKEALKNDPQAKNWADTPVPIPVLDQLRKR